MCKFFCPNTECRRRIFTERLPDVAIERALIKANLRSGWQLARRLAPFIQGKVGADVNLAIQEVIALYLPELKPHTPDVIAYMWDYFSIPETV